MQARPRAHSSTTTPHASTSYSPAPWRTASSSAPRMTTRGACQAAAAEASGSGTGSSLKQARRQSTHNLQLAWEGIFERYGSGDHVFKGRDDVWDIFAGKIVERRGGFLGDAADSRSIEIGDFGLPGAMGQDDPSSDEQEEPEEETIDLRTFGARTQSSSDSDSGDENGWSRPTLLKEHGAPRSRDKGKGKLSWSDRHRRDALKRQETRSRASSPPSSEDELGALGSGVSPVSEQYKHQKRVKEEMREDLKLFLSQERRSKIGECTSAASPPMTPTLHGTSSQRDPPVKRESVAPMSSQGTVRSAPAKLGRWTPASSIPPEASSSVCETARSRPGSSSSPFKSKHTASARLLISSSSAIPLGQGNTLLSQAIACEDDSSDDELSIHMPYALAEPKLQPAKRESQSRSAILAETEVGTSRYYLPSPPLSRSQPPPSRRNSEPVRSFARATPKPVLRPVVEVFKSTALPAAPLRSSTAPRRSSPLKRASTIAYRPASPPLSQSSEATRAVTRSPSLPSSRASSPGTIVPTDVVNGQVHCAATPASSTPELEDFSVPKARGRTPSPILETPARLCSTGKIVTPATRLSELVISPTAPPLFSLSVASRSTVNIFMPAASDAPHYVSARSRDACECFCSETLSQASPSSQPWTPPPSSASRETVQPSARQGPALAQPTLPVSASTPSTWEGPECHDTDVFKVPALPQPRAQNRSEPVSPKKRRYIVIDSSSEEEDAAEGVNIRDGHSLAAGAVHTPVKEPWRPSPDERASSVMSAGRRRLGSVAARPPPQRPPGDDGNESDDPLGI